MAFRSAIFLMTLLVALAAGAEPCGDTAGEGTCDGKTRIYCNGSELFTEECPECCGWNNNKFACRPCPAAGSCIEECLDGTSVFGCSLHNTHEWTCEVGADGCTDRNYVKCADDQVCNEAGSHKCEAGVDLCGGVSATGVCDGNVSKKCQAGKIVTTDCADSGQACVNGNCSADCPNACGAGTQGCSGTATAWSCLQDVQTGCLIQVEKKCGAKQCYQGQCVFEAEIPAEEEATSEVVEAEVVPEVPTGSGSGCNFSHLSIGETSLVLLATLIGFLLFLSLIGRTDPRRRRQKPIAPREPRQ